MESFRSETGWKPSVSVTVLKVLSPTRFLVREAPGPQMSQGGRDFIIMESKIKKLLKKQDAEFTSELPLEVGSIVLMNKPKENEWYRALINKVVDYERGYDVEVTLVDYGEVLFANRRQLRKVPNKRVLKVPFQCVEFSLLGLTPVSPAAVGAAMTAKQKSNDLWSVAAILYVNSMMKKASSVQVEVLGETVSGGLYGRLVVEWNKSFVILNEELVNLNYAILDPESGRDGVLLKEEGAQHKNGEDKHPSVPDLPVETNVEGSSLCHDFQKSALAEPQETLDKASKAFPPILEQHFHLDNHMEEVSVGTPICGDTLSSFRQQSSSSTSPLARSSEPQALSLKDAASKDLGKHEAVRSVDGTNVSTPTTMSSCPAAASQGSLFKLISDSLLQTLTALSEPVALPCTTGINLIEEPAAKPCGQVIRPPSGSTAAIAQVEEGTTIAPVQNSSPHLAVPSPSKNDGDNVGLVPPQAGASDRCLSQVVSKADKLKELLRPKKISSSGLCRQNFFSSPCASSTSSSSKEASNGSGRVDLMNPEMRTKAACAGSPDGQALDKAKPRAEKAASNPTKTKGQAAAKSRRKGPPKLGEYEGFMTPCHVIEEDVDQAAEEAKWNLKFTLEEPDLAAMNVCKATEDFCCHDFRNFSEVPPNLDPYMQLKNGAHFSANFGSGKLPSLPAQKSKLRALCHGLRAPKSATTCLDDTCFPDFMKERLWSLGFRGPSCIQSVVWPTVTFGRNVVAVAPPHSGKTLAYLIPLMSQVQTDSAYEELCDDVGPLVLILTSTWKGAQRIYEQVKLLSPKTKGPTCCTLYAAGSECGKEVPIVNGVDILVATPHSFLRYLNKYERLILNLNRCCHLVLDDGDRLLDKYKTEVVMVMREFLRSRKKKHLRSFRSPQILVCSTTWTNNLRMFLHSPEAIPNPLVMFSSFLEAAVYAQVPTVAHYVDPDARSEALLAILKQHCGQKVVVTMAKREVAIAAQQLLSSSGVHSLLVHDELTLAAIQEVSSEWTSAHPEGRSPVLVVQDSMLLLADIRDASVLVHYDIPELSEFSFGLRYSCIADRMRSFRDKGNTCAPDGPVSHVVITRDDGNRSLQLVEFLRRLAIKIPDELQQLAAQERTRVSTDAKLALCPNLKAFGYCEGQKYCSFRHQILPQVDHSPLWHDLPSVGTVRIKIIKVMSASHFYARILQHWEPGLADEDKAEVRNLEETVLNLGSYLTQPGNCKPLEEKAVPMPGQVFALRCTADHFQRVLVTSVAPGDRAPARVTVTHMDFGGQSTVAANKLIPLPPKLSQVRPQAVEVYCCGIKPPDGDVSWSFQADFRVHSLFFKKELVGKVALRLGNTLWFDRLVEQEKVPRMDVTVTVQSVGGTLVQEGFACKSASHVESLRQMAVSAGVSLPLPPSEKKPCRNSMNTTVKRHHTAHLDVESYNHVYLWKVVSPVHFYVQPARHTECLLQLEDDIQKAVEKRTVRKLKCVSVGASCIARCTNSSRWYRAEVLEFISDDEVIVFFPDYGDTATCHPDELFESLPSMMMLPYQGILCSLAGIGPPSQEWSEEAQRVLEDFGYDDNDINQMLCLRVVTKTAGDRQESFQYEVLLFNSCSAGRISAAKVLVDQRLANATELPALNFDINCPHECLPEEGDSGLPQSGSSDSGKLLVGERKMEDYMNNMYAMIFGQLQSSKREMESGPEPTTLQQDPACLSQAEETEKCEEPERQMQKVSEGEELLQEHHQSRMKKQSTKTKLQAALKSSMPLLDSQFKTASSLLAPVSWWQDHHWVYVHVLVANATYYELDVTASVLLFRIETAEHKFLVHERLRHSIVPEHTKLVQKEQYFAITLEKAPAKLTWDYLTRHACKVPHICCDLSRIYDEDEFLDAYKDPYFTGPTRSPVILPYDQLAHADQSILKEGDVEDDTCSPTMVMDRDFNNIFEDPEQ
ncbi:uncharacterized protein LOC144108122 [Amblyomma americanum]